MSGHGAHSGVASKIDDISEAIHENLDKVSGYAKREEAKLTPLQRSIERISLFFSEPRFLLTFVFECAALIVSDVVTGHKD
jgi:uncharacterized membrane protein